MSLLKDFKQFAMRGNVLDLAVGIILGLAFGKIVSSLVNDLIMPPIGLLIGGINFSDLKVVMKDAVIDPTTRETISAAVTLNLGVFIQAIFDFIIIAFAVFMIIRGANALSKKKEEAPAAPPAPSKEEVLLGEIRDILRESQRK
jgi:large conductance mechanosensitive channel